MKTKTILTKLWELFPLAACELDYENNFQLLIAVVLSAQTTDVKVNSVTKELFSRYPDPASLGQAELTSVKDIIKPLGLANNKSSNIISLSRKLVAEYQSVVPDDFSALVSLPGVGRKTANVVLLEAFKIPTIPVDTHVERVSKRLGLVEPLADVLATESQLMEILPKADWIEAHQLLIHFGRYLCKATKPLCEQCPFTKICQRKSAL
jgi:endonuclease-3